MFSFEILAGFVITAVILCFAPGPDNLFVLTQSALHGRKSGLFVTIGLCTGLIFHSCAVAFGVAVIFKTSIIAFNSLKILGTIYLLYLAWHAFKAKTTQINNDDNINIISYRKLYIRGILMNISNPKVVIFFLAFLPQFADPAKGFLWLQILFFGGVFIFCTLIVFSTVAVLAGTLGEYFSKSDKVQSILNKIAGTVFILLAIKLIITDI